MTNNFKKRFCQRKFMSNQFNKRTLRLMPNLFFFFCKKTIKKISIQFYGRRSRMTDLRCKHFSPKNYKNFHSIFFYVSELVRKYRKIKSTKILHKLHHLFPHFTIFVRVVLYFMYYISSYSAYAYC